MSMLDQAPASASAGRGDFLSNVGLSLWQGFVRLSGARRDCKLVTDISDFNDAELADIGLKRSDVEYALQQPLAVDPSFYLVRVRRNPLCGLKRF